jgi:hypothetical protein
MWEDNIKMNLTEIGWVGMVWNHLVQDRDQWGALMISEISLQAPQYIWKSFTR